MSTDRRDSGAVLPLVLVLMVVMSVLVIGLASYISSGLRYGRVVENRADRLAAADGGLRYGFETLRRGSFSDCLSALGVGGTTEVFPPSINGASTRVTCQKVSSNVSDVEGWGVIVTGDIAGWTGPLIITQGGGEKSFGGPVYVADRNRIDASGGDINIKFGDLWYTGPPPPPPASPTPTCPAPPLTPSPVPGIIHTPTGSGFGPICLTQPRASLFPYVTPSAVPTGAPTPATVPADPLTGCTVFYPGVYDGPIPLTNFNYFVSGDYLFRNVPLELTTQSVLMGFPLGNGDAPNVDIPECAAAQEADFLAQTAVAGAKGGVTVYAEGSTFFDVGNKAELEIFRREQTFTNGDKEFVSIFALPGAAPSNGWMIDTKSGNTNDISVTGLVWAPQSALRLGNITNAANGQLVGGVVLGRLDTQASASASAFSIGINAGPTKSRLLLSSTASVDGRSTTIRAVVEYRPDINGGNELAINSWRVLN